MLSATVSSTLVPFFVNGNNVEESVADNIYCAELSCMELSHSKLSTMSWLWRDDHTEIAMLGWPQRDGQ